MLLNFQDGTDWTQVKSCKECNVPPTVNCDLEWIRLTCPICKRGSITHITHGTQKAIDEWNRYHTEDWYK